jgi:serine phosphatase RsbU (regulator of sigma subunit)
VPTGSPRIGRATVVVVVLSLSLTAGLSLAAQRAHDANEDRLLAQQADEATAVLQASVPRILSDVSGVARVVQLLEGDSEAMREELAGDIRPDSFTSLAVIRRADGEAVVQLGEPSRLDESDVDAVLESTPTDPEVIHVAAFLEGEDRRIAYTTDVGTGDLVVVSEIRLTSPRISEDRQGDAFEAIDVAIYLGDDERADDLLTSTTSNLPIEGRRASRSIPFGDSELFFVVTPAETLGGGVLAVLPWLAAFAGLLSGGIAAVLVESLHRRRLDAEAFTEELHELYRREHDIAHTLQHSLLPTHLDRLQDVEVAARYFPGAEGAEIGGDWYDVINDADGTFTVVVGDVVGRGVKAAAVMAAMRYGTHAVAGQSTDPAVILSAVNRLEHIRGDFVTMLCGNIDPVERTVSFASAGHPAPLLISPDETRFLRVAPGPPIGFLDEATYPVKRTTLPHGSVVVLFTDGLYERRGESIEVGLERLREVASTLDGTVHDILDGLAEAMLGEGVSDDTAMLAIRV